MNAGADRLLEARIGDMLEKCGRGCSYAFSRFLDEHQCAEAELLCGREVGGSLKYRFFGGYEGAQRKMLCIYEEYCEDYIEEEFPLKCLTFIFRKEDRLTHRDFLGSLMGLQLKREVIGDIIIGEGIAQVFVTETAAKLIMTCVSKIGRTGVKVSDDRPFEIEVRQEFEEISTTVASLRLDCIVGAAAKLSREGSARIIRSERVSVNHFPEMSLSREIREGDVVSVRGSGRFILDKISGTTKKGRIHIILRKYK